MRAALVILSFLLLGFGANARGTRLPVPPIPPAQAPSTDAPVPNLDTPRPFAEVARSIVTLDQGINHRVSPDPGFGFAPGAHYRIDRDQGKLEIPGILLRLPFP